MAQLAKNPPATAGDKRDVSVIPESGRSPGEGMATHSGILAWRIPGTDEPGGLQSMHCRESDTTGYAHTHAHTHTHTHTIISSALKILLGAMAQPHFSQEQLSRNKDYGKENDLHCPFLSHQNSYKHHALALDRMKKVPLKFNM